jgi:hypothetical protein
VLLLIPIPVQSKRKFPYHANVFGAFSPFL